MDRKTLYFKIAELGLKDECVKRFGKNYTQVSNVELEKLIIECETSLKTNTSCKNCDKLNKLINILAKKHILLKSEVYSLG